MAAKQSRIDLVSTMVRSPRSPSSNGPRMAMDPMQNSSVAVTKPSVKRGLPERSFAFRASPARAKASSSRSSSPMMAPLRMLKIMISGLAVLKAICMPMTMVHSPSP